MTIAASYFKEHPEHKDGVMKAFFAYHVAHFRLFPGSHAFTSASNQSKCLWCGRTRELVRHDDLPPQCQHRPQIHEINECLLDEEIKANQLLEKASSHVPKLIERLGISGTSLATMHHTHGYDPEIISQFASVHPSHLADYEQEMNRLKAESKASQKREQITCKLMK